MKLHHRIRFGRMTAPSDPLFASVGFLSHCEYDPLHPNQIVDVRGNTVTGGALTTLTSARFGSSSANGGFTITNPNSNCNFSSGDFTIELWLKRPDNNGNYGILMFPGFNLYVSNNVMYCNGISYGPSTGNGTEYITWAHTWNNFTIVKNGSNCWVYLNGSARITGTAGAFSYGNISFYTTSNYYDEIRITKAARYTTTPFPLQTSQFLDQ